MAIPKLFLLLSLTIGLPFITLADCKKLAEATKQCKATLLKLESQLEDVKITNVSSDSTFTTDSREEARNIAHLRGEHFRLTAKCAEMELASETCTPDKRIKNGSRSSSAKRHTFEELEMLR